MLVLLLSLIAVQQSPITVELNHDQFTRGDRARVYLRAAQDGYLVVLHADPAGRIRVLFPRDPGDDDFIRGGKRQELVSRSNRDAFLIEADEGSGMVLAAWSADAFDHSAYVRTDHWDYRSLSAGTVKDDPLVVLLDVVQTMAAGREFEYDAVSYVVTRPIAARYSFGHPYHFGVGYGWYSPFYDPYCWDPFWSRCYRLGYFGYPYYRPYRYTYYRPYRPYWFNSGGFTSRRFVIPDRNRDRFAPVQPRPRSGANDGFVVRDRQPVRRTVEPRSAPRERSAKPRNVAPRDRSATPRSTPRVAPSQPRGSGSRPSVSRGSSGGSKPAARPAPSGRSGGGRTGGGRRP